MTTNKTSESFFDSPVNSNVTSDFFSAPLYPRLTEGKFSVILTSYKNPVAAKKKDGTPTAYIPLTIVLPTGKPVTFNVFTDQFQSRFVSPVQAQVDPENKTIWTSLGAFLKHIVDNKIPLDCWIEHTTYLASSGVRSAWNFNFFEPAPKTTPAVNSQITEETATEDIPF